MQVEIEDLERDENRAVVNPLPVDFPLLLVDLRKVNSGDIDSIVRAIKFPSYRHPVTIYK